jgi:hypothetical protein
MTDFWIMMLIGGVFIILGAGILLWGRREEKEICQTMTNRIDVRRYMEHKSEISQSWGFKVGGIITIVIGSALLVMGGVFWLWG